MTVRRAFALLLLWAAWLASAGPAQAFGIPLPCTGEQLVKVLDIPATRGRHVAGNAEGADRQIDLGYLFRGCWDGAWVGHIGDDTRYVPLDEHGLRALLQLAGLDEPPPVPSLFASGRNRFVFGLWLLLIPASLLAAHLRRRHQALVFGRGASPFAPVTPGGGDEQPPVPASYSGAYRAIEQAAAERAGGLPSNGQAPAAPRALPREASPRAFGRRATL